MYVWGSNTDGQLGLGPDAEEALFAPAVLQLPSSFPSPFVVTYIRYGINIKILSNGNI